MHERGLLGSPGDDGTLMGTLQIDVSAVGLKGGLPSREAECGCVDWLTGHVLS